MDLVTQSIKLSQNSREMATELDLKSAAKELLVDQQT
jgi:hypothetical protein